jgi:PAS domain S-box-containing protein
MGNEESQMEPGRVSLELAELLGVGAELGTPLLTIDPRGRVLAMNAAAEALTGWSQDQAQGQSLEQVCAALHCPLWAWVAELLEAGGGAVADLPCVCAGQPRELRARALRLDDAQGHLTALVLALRDVTERRPEFQQLLDHIHDQRHRTDSIVANMPGVVWESWGAPDDAAQQTDFVSGYAEQLLGYPLEDWLSAPNFWLTLVHPEDRARVAAEVRALFERGWGGVLQFRWVARSRRVIWVEAHCVVIRDPQGRPVGMRGVTMDITARKLAEQERDRLLELERAWHRAAELARRNLALMAEVSALLADPLDDHDTLARVAGMIVPQLADWCALDLAEPEQAPRTVALAHFSPDQAERARALHQRLLSEPEGGSCLVRVLRGGPSELCNAVPEPLRAEGVSAVLVVPLAARGRTLGALTCVLAESGRSYTGADLALAEELARRIALALDNARLYHDIQDAVHARDQFLSVASHELKTPLTALLGYADLVQRRLPAQVDERDRRALKIIHEQSARLNRLVTTMLDLSRIQSGRLAIEHSLINLGALAEHVAAEMRPTLDHHAIEIETPKAPLLVEGDAQRLEQVLQNLISNAVKYSPGGGVVRARVFQRADKAVLEVEDEGIGIPPASLPRLFDRFYRASNVDAQHISGLGIGLYIVKEIVRLHRGAVSVRSREHQGSTFTVVLPLAEAQRPYQRALGEH